MGWGVFNYLVGAWKKSGLKQWRSLDLAWSAQGLAPCRAAPVRSCHFSRCTGITQNRFHFRNSKAACWKSCLFLNFQWRDAVTKSNLKALTLQAALLISFSWKAEDLPPVHCVGESITNTQKSDSALCEGHHRRSGPKLIVSEKNFYLLFVSRHEFGFPMKNVNSKLPVFTVYMHFNNF